MKATLIGAIIPMNNGSGSLQVTSHSETVTVLESDLQIFDDSFFSSITTTIDAFIKTLTTKFNNLRSSLSTPVVKNVCRQAGKYNAGNTLITYGIITPDWNDDVLQSLNVQKVDGLVTIIKYEFQGYSSLASDTYHFVKGARLLGNLPSYNKTYYINYDKFTKLVTSVSETEPSLPYVKIDIYAKADGFDPEYTFDSNFNSPSLKLVLSSDNTQTLTLVNTKDSTAAQGYKRLGITVEQGATQYNAYASNATQLYVPSGFITEGDPMFEIGLNICPAAQAADVVEVYSKI